MYSKYCAWCGHVLSDSDAACPKCGYTVTTDEPPSQEPCIYCGARPSWPVVWRGPDGIESTIYMCAECDERETEAMEAFDYD